MLDYLISNRDADGWDLIIYLPIGKMWQHLEEGSHIVLTVINIRVGKRDWLIGLQNKLKSSTALRAKKNGCPKRMTANKKIRLKK